jgi:two-component system, chemotaxis family, protein-glutamate methylesterase/glutaminase
VNRTINVLVVDDSPTARQMLCHVINQEADFHVVGVANDGEHAVDMAHELRPDVILMDSVMPKLGGVESTRKIMQYTPTPIVVISASLNFEDTQTAFDAIKAGALTTLRKPVGPNDPQHKDQVRIMLSTLRAMAGVAVIHHRPVQGASAMSKAPVQNLPAVAPQLVGIVSSTGGPAALAEIIKGLPETFPIPIAIVQHMAPDFVPSLQVWLSSVTRLKVRIAEDKEIPRPGYVYLAPGGKHLTLNSYQRFSLNAAQGTELHVPSGDVLLHSISQSYGAEAVGIVLTGMGSDGARGLRHMYEAGAFTIAQDATSCVVYGMPKEAVERGAVRQVLPLSNISEALHTLTNSGESYESKTTRTNR